MNTLTAFLPIVNPAFEALPFDLADDEYRPTDNSDVYDPTPEDEAAYAAFLATLDAREDVMAEWAEADRIEAMESAFRSPWDLVSDAELIECGGFHPAASYED